MAKGPISVFLMLSLALPLIGQAARGAPSPARSPVPGTATAQPTSTPLARLPSGLELLARARLATIAGGSVRVITTDVFTQRHLRAVSRTIADVSFRHDRARESNETHRTGPSVGHALVPFERDALLFVYPSVAWRSLGGPWHCEPEKWVRPLTFVLPLQVTASSALNLGLETIDGSPVWHVHVPVAASTYWNNAPATADYFVAMRTGRLVQFDAQATGVLGPKRAHFKDRVDVRFVRYGERVRVRLPHGCRAGWPHLGGPTT